MVDTIMNKPVCELGYPWTQLEEEMSREQYLEFREWMTGQTMAICQGKLYNHKTRQYEESCGGVGHGGVVYAWDLDRYLSGLPVID